MIVLAGIGVCVCINKLETHTPGELAKPAEASKVLAEEFGQDLHNLSRFPS